MTIRIQSLFLKIFLWFWATVVATGIALIATWIVLQPKNATFAVANQPGRYRMGFRNLRRQ